MKKCEIIAEAGINYDGNINKAKRLIKEASKAGADIIKFQIHIADAEMVKSKISATDIGKETLYDLIKRMELPEKTWRELKNYAEETCNIEFLATPFSIEAADLMERLDIKRYKIGSGELTNQKLLSHIAKKNKPILLSTGMSTYDEIENAINIIWKNNPYINITLLHCTSTYPTKYEDVRLPLIQKLKERFNLNIGLSDHSKGVYTALASIALGASIIEKHFTINRRWRGPDQKSSIEPTDLRLLVEGRDAIVKAMSADYKYILKDEEPTRAFARGSLVSSDKFPKDYKLKEKDITIKRPGEGIPPWELKRYIGKKLKKSVKKNYIFKKGDFY